MRPQKGQQSLWKCMAGESGKNHMSGVQEIKNLGFLQYTEKHLQQNTVEDQCLCVVGTFSLYPHWPESY